jgi:succinoglycan biosynthesis transport protein ExoP
MIRRQWPLVSVITLSFLVLAVTYLMVAPPRYSTSFLVLIDTKKDSVIANRRDEPSDRPMDPGVVESQTEILKSDNVAMGAVRSLKLVERGDDEEKFWLSSLMASITNWIASFSGPTPPPTRAQLEQAAVDDITSRIKTKRLGVTYVVETTYTDSSAQKTYEIAKALADAYLTEALDARFQATKRTSDWLQGRIADMRQQVFDADSAVQAFKAANNIVDTARGLISEQQLADVNSQLINAKATTAEAKAKLDRVQEVAKGSLASATVSDAMHSEVINRLRAQYLDLSAKEAELAAKYGENHGAVVNLRNQMAQLSRAAKEELDRIAEASRSEYQIAAEREKSLRASLQGLVDQASTSNQAQVKLRNLDSAAQTYRTTYESMLQKFQESIQEQTVPINEARIITPPTFPLKPSWPKPLIVIPGGIVLGLLFGCFTAVMREALGNGFRVGDDIRSFAGVEYLGTLPKLKKASSAIKKGAENPGILGNGAPTTRETITSPFSRFTETIRNVKVSIDAAKSLQQTPLVAITSSVPKEGKTTISANLAHLTAQMGLRTLLIDADLHAPALTATLAPHAEFGLVEILTEGKQVSECICTDSITGLDFLPAVIKKRQPNTISLLKSKPMLDLLASAREYYDYVFIDLPPVVPVVDARATAPMFDFFVFIVEWSRTSRDVVRDALGADEELRHRVLGVLLNQADPTELKRLEAYRGSAYGHYYYESDGEPEEQDSDIMAKLRKLRPR